MVSMITSLNIVILIAALIFLFALCLWFISIRSEKNLKKTIEKESDNTLFQPQFRCVVFSAGSNACRKALEYQTKPILLSNAPALPLQGCYELECKCSLLEHDDRRISKDRRGSAEDNKNRRSAYANKRLLKDRRRASIKDYLLPQYRSFGQNF